MKPRYSTKDVCTNCFYDSCESCRGNGCACQKFNHPPGHASTYVDSEGEERCECGKWLEPGYHAQAEFLQQARLNHTEDDT